MSFRKTNGFFCRLIIFFLVQAFLFLDISYAIDNGFFSSIDANTDKLSPHLQISESGFIEQIKNMPAILHDTPKASSLILNRKRRINYNAVVNHVEMDPVPGENVAISLGEDFEVRVTVYTTEDVDPKEDDLRVALWTDISPTNYIQLKDISMAEDAEGNPDPRRFIAKIRITPKSPGFYTFTAFAKTRYQANTRTDREPVFVEGKESAYLQVHQIPKWAQRDKTHPYYLFLQDVETDGHALNWTGIKEYIGKTLKNTGKNLFILSPFFPTPGASPFTPLSVFALSPRFIDWASVMDRGETPVEKFRYFQKKSSDKRRGRFKKFSDNPEIKNYAELIAQRTVKYEGQAVYGVHYNINDFKSLDEFKNFIVYEQFVNLEQMYDLLIFSSSVGARICGDLPFYRAKDGADAEFNRWYFAQENGEIISPGFKGGNDQIWGDLAAWDEQKIYEFTIKEGYDPRLLPFKYWNDAFGNIFKDNQNKFSGWRMDALHMYGRGSYKDDAKRIIHNTLLWDDVADYFQQHNLFPIVEQLGADWYAFGHFLKRKGFAQYAIILDLKHKCLQDFIADLASISRGLAITVVDTHDSFRWANEYMKMFEYLSGKPNPDNDPQIRDEILRLVGPAFFAFLFLAPKMESVTLSLAEYGTQDSVKKETCDENGTVIGSQWGTREKGGIDLSFWIKKFVEIRETNPAVSNSAMVNIPNNDPEHLVSVSKAYQGNNLLIAANFSNSEKTIEFPMPLVLFNVSSASLLTFKELITGQNVTMENHVFKYVLPAGGICVFRLESAESDMQKWLKDNFLPYVSTYRYFDAERHINEYFAANGVLSEASLKEMLSKQIFKGPIDFAEWDWVNNKNKEVMLHSGQVLVARNSQPFIIYLKEEGQDKERIIPTFSPKGNNQYINMLFGLKPGKYTLRLFWPHKKENHGWEGQNYHFRVLPEVEEVGKPGELDESSLQVRKEDFAQYPHSTVTLANGRGSILRIPIRPLKRNQWDGAIEVAGFTSKYDGFQVNLLQNAPDEQRKVIFRGTVDDATIKINGVEKGFHLDMETMDNFARYPLPRWRFIIQDGEERVVIDKSVVLVEGENRFTINYKVVSATAGVENVTLYVRPDINMRNHHEPAKHWEGAVQFWDSKHRDIDGKGFRIYPVNDDWKHWYPGFDGIKMTATKGLYKHASEWHYNPDPIESERGQDSVNDAYSPGFFTIPLSPGKDNSSSLVFSCVDALTPDANYSQADAERLMQEQVSLLQQRISQVNNPQARKDSFVQKMVAGVWSFVAKRDEFYTVIAGYPWFSDWGRDTFLCFEGLLAAGMDDIAKGLLMAFGKFEKNGMLPNIITGETAGNWDTVDAPLLYVLSVKNYIDETGDKDILNETTGGRTILEIIESIMRGYYKGTENGIAMDTNSKLIWSPSHFTWMDTNHPACTPRQGYTVENNARWHDVLRFLSDVYEGKGDTAKSSEFKSLAQEVKDNFNKYFWVEREGGYFGDVIECEKGKTVSEGIQDIAIRPNQLIAVLSPYDLLSKERQKKVVDIVTKKLLVPGGLRTLSEDTASSSQFPYRGNYEGDEDTQRKQAYHNGTVWPHLFGDWAVAYVIAHDYSEESVRYVLPYFGALEEHLRIAGVGSVSEVRDGNYPHWPRGCSDQAWSMAMNLAAYMRIRYSRPLNLNAADTADKQNVLKPEQVVDGMREKDSWIERSI